MQWVTRRHAHGQAEELAHEMVLQVREDHLKAIEMCFRTDEAGDIVDHEWIVAPGEAVTERLGGRHVDAVMFPVSEFTPLAGLEIHELARNVLERAFLGHGAVAMVQEVDRDIELR